MTRKEFQIALSNCLAVFGPSETRCWRGERVEYWTGELNTGLCV